MGGNVAAGSGGGSSCSDDLALKLAMCGGEATQDELAGLCAIGGCASCILVQPCDQIEVCGPACEPGSGGSAGSGGSSCLVQMVEKLDDCGFPAATEQAGYLCENAACSSCVLGAKCLDINACLPLACNVGDQN